MKFLKNNFKIIGIAIIGVFVQFFIIGAMISNGNKDKRIENERMERQDLANSSYYELDFDDEFDVIEESKKTKYNRNNEDIEDGEEDADTIKTGKVDVDIEFKYDAEGRTENESIKTTRNKVQTKSTTSKPKSEANKPDKKTELKDDIEKAKRMAIGTWKSVNDSDGKFENFYIEFFEDSSYQKYNESRSIVYTGKYTFSSLSKMKMTYETIKLSNVDSVREESESFTLDINFKDEKNFSVSDIKRFSFSNYKKIK